MTASPATTPPPHQVSRVPGTRVPRRGEPPLVVGTRGSALALWQTNWVLDQLRERVPHARCVVQTIKTQGDRTQPLNVPLAQLGDKGMFVAELERALLAGALDGAIQPMRDHARVEAEADLPIDLAVHSLKDLPSTITAGLTLAAVTEREDARDALVSRAGLPLADLPPGATVATSSLRRRAQLLHLRPDVRIVEIRGNVDTRLRKALAEDGPDATILAVAGLKRLGLAHYITEYLPVDVLVPAVGQGALAVEVRVRDRRARRLLRPLDSPATRQAITAERTVLATLGGGCQVPLGAHAVAAADGSPEDDAILRLIAVVASPDGQRLVRAEGTGPARHPVALGRRVARELVRQGAGEIVRAALTGI
ncbi:MAG: hydroxymethylbilane synthase [Ktedonobacterales bacterium]|nr:hydroxymethylbilane synthase [Ktedonobacterales bacterium]